MIFFAETYELYNSVLIKFSEFDQLIIFLHSVSNSFQESFLISFCLSIIQELNSTLAEVFFSKLE